MSTQSIRFQIEKILDEFDKELTVVNPDDEEYKELKKPYIDKLCELLDKLGGKNGK